MNQDAAAKNKKQNKKQKTNKKVNKAFCLQSVTTIRTEWFKVRHQVKTLNFKVKRHSSQLLILWFRPNHLIFRSMNLLGESFKSHKSRKPDPIDPFLLEIHERLLLPKFTAFFPSGFLIIIWNRSCLFFWFFNILGECIRHTEWYFPDYMIKYGIWDWYLFGAAKEFESFDP